MQMCVAVCIGYELYIFRESSWSEAYVLKLWRKLHLLSLNWCCVDVVFLKVVQALRHLVGVVCNLVMVYVGCT